jgi:hypothetical protein
MAAIPSSGGASRAAASQPPPEPATPPTAAPPDPVAIEAAEWQRVSRNATAGEIEAFLKRFPSGANAPEARRSLERLDWGATDRNNRGALQTFLAKHPSGLYASQAGADIARLDNEAAARLKLQQEAERLRGERAQIRAVLRGYGEAFGRKDDKGIIALWPSMPSKDIRDVRASFRDFQSLKIDFEPVGDPEIAGAAAKVQCRRTTIAIDRNGSHATEGTVTVQLQKRDGRWVIDSIR